MTSISSVNISKVSQVLSFNTLNANQAAQQNNLTGLNSTQSSQLVANISRSISDSESVKMQTSDKKGIQMEKKSEGSFGSSDERDDEEKNSEENPIKRLNTKI